MPRQSQYTDYVGPRLKFLTHAFVRKFSEVARSAGAEDQSMMHSRIIAFLYCNRDREIFQKDLEEHFHITRSSVTSLVKRMERNGDLVRQSVERDARLKKILLTHQAIASCERTIAAMDQVEALAVRGLTREQLDHFFTVCDVIAQNLTGKECDSCHDQNHCVSN